MNLEQDFSETTWGKIIIENAKDSGVLQQANKELMEEVKQPKTYSGPLAEVRQKAAEVDKELGLLLDGVKDMDVKQNIKTFFNKKLNKKWNVFYPVT